MTAIPVYDTAFGARPEDINRMIECDEHACALQDLAFWLTVPGWRPWVEYDVGPDGERIERAAEFWPLPVHVHEDPVYGPWFGAWHGRTSLNFR